ncbi:MAG TPA: nickel pincer cofactor biosynthesis protein LarB [Acidimicrobiales bacterium]
MDDAVVASLLEDVRRGTVTPDEAMSRLRRLPFADLGFARVDHHRLLRQHLPEAIYGPGKTPAQCAALVAELREGGGPVILTRASDEQLAAVEGMGGAVTVHAPGWSTAVWDPAAGRPGRILVVTAGTADLPVAGECTATLAALGFRPALAADCGVAGVHRLLATMDELEGADAVVVVAGMEGALASVVGGLTGAPVVAVPASTGYGAALEGITALLAMLSSCAAGITVVGIDNGFGAACAVARLLP